MQKKDKRPGAVVITVLKDGSILTTGELPLSPSINAEYVFKWTLYTLQLVLFKGLPAATISSSFSPAILSIGEEQKKIFTMAVNVIQKTNQAILDNSHLKDIFSSHTRILVGEIDHNGIGADIAKKLESISPGSAVLIDFLTGWNNLKRVFEIPKMPSVSDLLETIKKEKIKKVISTNMYYPNFIWHSEKIHVQALLHHLGIQYICLDIDTYELTQMGYLDKAVFNNPEIPRFSTMPGISLVWDKKWGINNVTYVPVYSEMEKDKPVQVPDDNYDIVILAHARTEFAVQWLPSILFYLSMAKTETLFYDAQLIHFVLREILHNLKNVPTAELTHLEKILTQIQIAVISFLKYEVLFQLKTSRKVKLHGDTAWKNLFPQYYQENYLSSEDRKNLFAQKKSLQLIFNQNYSYLENNPVYSIAFNESRPILGYPPVVSLEPFKGFSAIEYKNVDELNHKIENIASFLDEPFNKSLAIYKNQFEESEKMMTDILLGHKISKMETFYSKGTKESEALLQNNILTFFNANKEKLVNFVEHTFFGKPLYI